jgi:CubicO group peptidase (beta-lactamase class C family)
MSMDRSLAAALDYVPRWLDFQMRDWERPGLVVAIAERGRVVFERAWGHADLKRGTELTPRHRFRVASHSKSFTAAGIMKLRERRKLHLDDPVGRHVEGLHRGVGAVTLAQLLSHSGGLMRDGRDSGQWQDRRPFLNAAELLADLAEGPTIDPNTRFKYSNHGYGLVGMAMEAITGEPYNRWIKREIVEAAGLEETEPDVPLRRGTPFSRGHSMVLPLGRRVVIPGENSTDALAPATGFISTAADLVRWFSGLDPKSRHGVISAASRREMIRHHWRNPHSSIESYYGLGVGSGTLGDWDHFGHGGGFQGYITRTLHVPARNLTISVLTNSADGLAGPWLDGILHILRCFAQNGAPPARLKGWSGRWWTLWGTVDLVPTAKKVFVAVPAFFNPFMDASEIEVTGRDRGRIALASGVANHGEPARLKRNAAGRVQAVQLAGIELRREPQVVRELMRRYEGRSG